MLLFSPAKINLFLYVTGRRPNGYHELCTLMHTVGYGDRLSISLAEQDTWSCSQPSLPMDSHNLVVRALHLFRKETSLYHPIAIHLDKRIPMQAGLGGGSSNAATTLWALNQLHGSPVDIASLQQWGLQLGADVPFFFSEGSALCTGIGEILTPQPKIQSRWFLHLPKVQLSTPRVFQQLKPPYEDPYYQLYYNRLESIALALEPSLELWKANWSTSYSHVFMTGSGSTFVGTGGSHPDGIPVDAITRQSACWYADPEESTVAKPNAMVE